MFRNLIEAKSPIERSIQKIDEIESNRDMADFMEDFGDEEVDF
jgi:hypothetical protein